MPRYKVNEKTYNLPEDKVEGFLQKFPDAIAIEDEAQDFPTSTVEDADAVQQPMTASQAGYVDPKDTESSSVVGLSDSRIEDIEKNFKVGYYHPEQREAYKNWEETGEVDGALLPDFDVDDYKKTERVINDDFRKEVESIYQESAKGVKLDKFGSFDYDDKESIANFRDRAINKLIKENKTIQDKILPQAASQAKFEFDSVNDKLKEKYGINSKNVSQENIDNYTKEATTQFNALVNSKVNSTPEFKQIITDFNSVMDETGRVSLDAFTRGKDWESGMILEKAMAGSPNSIGNLAFKFIQQTYAGGKGIKDGLDEAGVYGAIQMNERFISQLDSTKEKAKKQKWDTNTQGWWRQSDNDLANAFKFVKITNENQIIPSGVTKGSLSDYENSVNKKTEAEDLSIRKKLIDVADQQLVTAAYGADEFKNFMKGDNMLENSVSMIGKQLLPQMAIAITTAGVGNAIQMGSGMYVDGINNKIREKYGLTDGEEITQDMLKNVISDDKFIDTLVAKSVAGGLLAGQLERLGAGKLLSNLTNKGAASILRMGVKRYAQRVGGQVIRNFSSGATEAITEVLQEVISVGVADGKLDKEQLFEAGGTGFLVSAMTGLGGNVVTETVQEVKTLNRVVAGKLNPKSAEAFFNTKTAEINDLLKNETKPSKIEELQEKKQAILNARNANLKIPSNFSIVTKEKIFDLIEEKQGIEKEIENKDTELVRNQTNRIKEINTELNVISSLETQIKTVEKLTKDVKGLTIESLDNAEAITNFIEENNIDVDSKKASNEQGFIYQNPKTGEQTIVINKEIAAKDRAVNVAAHEFLHGLIFQTVKNSPETQIALGKSLNEYINKIDVNQIKDSNFAKRLESYKDMDEATQSEEVLTLFSDAIATGDIQFNESVFTKIGDVIRRTLQNLGVKVKFNNGKDVYNFVKDYNKSIEKGKLTKAQKAVGKKGAKGALVLEKTVEAEPGIKESKQLTPEQDTQLRSDVAEIKKEASESEALAKKFNKDFIKGAKQTRLENKVLNEIKPVVERVITNRTKALYDPIVEDAKKLVSREMFQESMRSDIETMVLNEFTGKQDIEKFIVNRGFLRANNLAERLGIKNAEEGIDKNLDTAKTILVEETEQPKTDRPRYRNILKSNVLPTETTAKVKDKVLKTVRTLKSKLNTKISINKTVTPLIAEIKENMGKQADIDFKKAMGGKKDGQLKRFLIKNKKAILENMTTTWLVKAMPGAIQKQVDGNFISDWQGKKIDREKTTTQQAGRTSGAEIVRRLPNAFKNLDDKTYLGYVVDESGAPIRGRKESLAKAMAEELSFDIFAAEIQDENSEISRAFESNQEALGEVLKDNFVAVLEKDLDRGTVKFSMSLKERKNLINVAISEGINSQKIKDIAIKNGIPEKEFSAVLENIIHEGILQKMQDAEASNQGLKYEEALEVVLNTFTSSDIKVEKIKRRKGDISIKGGGKTYKVEVKLNDKAQIGSISTGLFTIKDGVISLKDSNNLKINSKLSEENKKVFVDFLNNNKKYLNNLAKAINEANTESSEKAIINKNGHLKLPYSEFWENIKDKMPNNQAGHVSYEGNQSIIEDFYKGIDLMQIGDYGAYAIGNQSKLAGFYQKLEATTNNVLRPVRSGTTVYMRLFPNFKEIKNERKDSLSTAKGISTLAKTIRAAVELDYIETGQKAINNANSNTYSKLSKRLDVKAEDISELITSKAKADWLINKIAEGYNDFYFIDNKMNEVKAVKDVLNTFDVKGRVQQAKVKFSKSMNTTFNEMLQRSTGIEAGETIERSIARRRGATKGKFKVWMPSSLDDFKGLTSYTFAGKGKQGEADQKFFQDALITPYFRGIRAIEQSRQAFKDDFKTLNKQMRPVLKKLGKIVPGTEFTHDQAIRVALWTASGYDIPGISESDIKTLVDFVNDNADLSEYARKLQLISKRKEWSKPGDFWDAETILSDLNNLTEKVGRKEYLTEFIENVDIIFSEDNLNKVEAGYGEAQKEALKDIIYRMKNGTNRPSGANKNENRFNNWVNNSIGAIMFFNRRSALLQTLSIANFINWGDNNVLKAGAAFANQPQYWKDFATLFNSSKLKQRRSGLKSDVNEAEIANAVKGSRNKAVSALSYLLKIGFTPTQLADSFAIASGGATFYRNRANSYLKEVNAEGEKIYTQKQAEEKAFEDFSQISEETQQSGDPALISSDQASTLGRMILAFQNTPIQLNRSIKKAALDIKNRRRTPGQTMLQSDFSNISKIIYYGTVQNIIFSALQNALFALIPGFEDEDDALTEEEQLEKYGKIYSTKQSRIVNGMVDTTLKGGFGVPGAFISTIKNAYLEYAKQKEKGFIGDQGYTILAAANLSPPVGSKLRKIYSAIKTEEFDKDVIAKRGWDITIDGKFNLSPKYKVLGSVTEGLTNLPLDRMVAEVSSIAEALDARNSKWQRIALALGWKTWDVNVKNEEHELIKTEAKTKRKEEGKIKAKETRAKNKKEKDKKAKLERIKKINKMSK